MKRTLLSITLLIAAGVSVVMVVSSGCVNVKAPERITIGGDDIYSPPPSSEIPPADPNNAADLRRENEQLRQRIAWLEKQNHKLDKKMNDLQEDMDEVRADMKKIANQRDRYRRAAGK